MDQGSKVIVVMLGMVVGYVVGIMALLIFGVWAVIKLMAHFGVL